MKQMLITTLTISCLLLSACNHTSVGVIGGADGPTNIYVKGQFGEQYEKKPIRMMHIDGDLYFDAGLVSDSTARCGTLDGEVTKNVGEGEVPQNDGEANFDAAGYQHATGITKEVPVDGEWVIFKKYENPPEHLEEYPYCFYIKGHLNNAVIDSELVVLTDDKEISFSDVYAPMLSSVKPTGGVRVSHNQIASGDPWGITLSAENVTNQGLTIQIEQFGGNPTGEIQTGEWYTLETTVNDEWQPVKAKQKNAVWQSIAYGINKNDVTELKVDWEWLYGALPPGFYRLSKEMMDFRAAGDYDKELYELYFTIE